MDVPEAVKRRRMTRSYDPDRPIPAETVSELLSLANRAPSAGHTQGWRFLVLDDITSRDRFWTASSTPPENPWLVRMRTAPVLVIVFTSRSDYLDRYAEPDKGWTDRSEERWSAPFWYVDSGMAAMVLLLAAEDAGLGACFFGVPADRVDDLRSVFDVPTDLAPVGVISLGYRARDLRSPSLKRGRRSDTIFYRSFASESEQRTPTSPRSR